MIYQASNLPIVININPRSIYNKTEDFKLVLEQYVADIVCLSETWERENLSLEELLNLEDSFSVISNVKQRDFAGGKPAILVNKAKFNVTKLCPDPVTVPVGVEAVWALVSHKNTNHKSRVKYIAVCSLYYRGPKSTTKQELFDHVAQTFYYLKSKYGKGLEFIISGDTNRLNLVPILNLSPDLQQVVKVPTRLNPDKTLDKIISTMQKFYSEPVTKPPLFPDSVQAGAPSDHLIVLWKPLLSETEIYRRQYKIIKTRPLTRSGLSLFHKLITSYNWTHFYRITDVNEKAQFLKMLLAEKYTKFFPQKVFKVSSDDKPWFKSDLKALDRKRKREFNKHHKSEKWEKLNKEFGERCKAAKEQYFKNMVSDLKESNPSKWYSKLKRMSGIEDNKGSSTTVEALIGRGRQSCKKFFLFPRYTKL